MRLHHSRWVTFVAVAPLAVGVQSPDSSSYTSFYGGAGAGDYAVILRGCDGVISRERHPFRDYGASVEHKFHFPVRAGLRAGAIEEGDILNRYANPNFSIETRKFSIGSGLVLGQRSFSDWDSRAMVSGHVRIGDLEKVYFSAALLENVPLYSGGGELEAGLGGGSSRVRIWSGLSVGPYDGAGVGVKLDLRLTRGLSLAARGRLGSSEGITENALSFGLSYRWVHSKRQHAGPAEAGSASPRDTASRWRTDGSSSSIAR